MYHIKEDKRTKKTLKLILQAFDKCLEAHSFSDMTITEVCTESTVSRATFYRLFDSLDDIIIYKCELLAEEFAESTYGCGIHEIQLNFFAKWIKNINLLKLIQDLNRTEIIYDCHKHHLEQIKNSVQFSNIRDTITDYHLSILTSTLVATLITWCNHGCKESTEELVTSINGVFNDLTNLFNNSK